MPFYEQNEPRVESDLGDLEIISLISTDGYMKGVPKNQQLIFCLV